jgi:hypothetical protein
MLENLRKAFQKVCHNFDNLIRLDKDKAIHPVIKALAELQQCTGTSKNASHGQFYYTCSYCNREDIVSYKSCYLINDYTTLCHDNCDRSFVLLVNTSVILTLILSLGRKTGD